MKRIHVSVMLLALLPFFACSTEQNPADVDEAQALEDLAPADVDKVLVEEDNVNNAEALQIVKGINDVIEIQYATFTTVVEANNAVIEVQQGDTVAVRRSGDVKVSVRFDGDDVLWSTEIKGVEVMTVRRLENNDLQVDINDQSGQLQAQVVGGELQVTFADNAGNKFTLIEKNGGGVTVIKNNNVLQAG